MTYKDFQTEVIDRLARIETILNDRPCTSHQKDIDWLKTKVNVGIGGVTLLAFILGFFK